MLCGWHGLIVGVLAFGGCAQIVGADFSGLQEVTTQGEAAGAILSGGQGGSVGGTAGEAGALGG
ncbi:MAG: hypothetical protein RMJ98_03380, partial [Myxococcales bacterium]|nr:hypothetical protein [Myxococcales bacterium]